MRLALPTARSLTALVLAAAPCHAQAPASGAGATAESLFLEGRAAMQAGDYAGARPKLAESQRLDPSLGTLLNLGLCEELLGDLISARERLRAFINIAPPSDDRLEVTSSHLTALERRVPHLELQLAPGASPLTQITLDGVVLVTPRGREALDVPLNPGRHELVARAPGGPPAPKALYLDEGQMLLHVVAPPPARPPPSRDEPAPTGAGRTLGFVGVGVGAFGLAAGAVLGVVLLERKDFIEAHCPAERCDDAGFGAVGRARTLSTAATTSLALGLSSAAAGAYLLATSPRPTPRRTFRISTSPSSLSFVYHF